MGGKTSTSTQSVSIPPEVMARYNAVNARAEDVASTPFQQYGGQFVAGLTPTQQSGIQATNVGSQTAQPYYQLGSAYTVAGAQDVGALTPGQIGYYQNPAMLATVAPTAAALRQQQGQQLSQQQSDAIKAGAFGGSRADLARAQLMGQQQLGMGQALAPIYQQAYQTGLQTAQQQQGVISQDLARRMQAGQQLANLGTGAQQAALQGAQAQIQAGTAEQQTQQADLTARYQQFLQERGYPFQVAQFLANIAMGTGALSGSTTTTTQPAGFFSDRRLKHDAHRIGETDDGIPIYSFKYNGDDKTQIGLMAQDVEKKRPEAVGLAPAADGKMYKTVDYEKATRRGRDAGGLIPSDMDQNSMGGAVDMGSALQEFARGGYAIGGGAGLLGENDLSAVLKSQQQFLGPLTQGGPYGQQGKGVGSPGYVPQSTLPTPKLVTAGNLPAAQKSGLGQAVDFGKNVASTYQAGKDIKKDLGELSDWLSKKAEGGLIVGRHHYDDGGDVFGQSDDDEKKGQINPAGVPRSGFAQGVLESGKQHAELATAKGGPGGGGGSGLGSGLKDAASLIGAGKGLYEGGKWLSTLLFAANGGRIDPYVYGGVIPREHHADGEAVGEERPQEDPALALIRRREGFRETPYYDVNAHRVGYGSDTITTPEGQVLRVSPDMRVTRADAERDLNRRVGEFQNTARSAIGDDAWNALHPNAKAAITSLTYNYGRVPDSVAQAAQSGDMAALGAAVNALGVHNKGINAGRRAEEATMIHPEGKYQPPGLITGESGSARRPGIVPVGQDNIYAGVPAEKASLGDVAREYLPSGVPTSEKFWVPALGFLGSMLASKSPFLGQAIGEGIVGGVGAYTALNKQEADIAKTQAETGNIQAQELERRAGLAPMQFIPGYGFVIFDRTDPRNPKIVRAFDTQGRPMANPPPLTKEQIDSAQPASNAPGVKQPTSAVGDLDPATIRRDQIPATAPANEQPLPDGWAPVSSVPEGFMPRNQFQLGQDKNAQAKGSQDADQKRAMSEAATSQLLRLEEMRRDFQRMNDSAFLKPGSYINERLRFAKTINTAASMVGGKLAFDPDAVGAAENLDKSTFRLGTDLIRGLGREPGFILNRAVDANPSGLNSPSGYARISSSLEQVALRERDLARFVGDYYRKYQHTDGAEQLFNELNPYTKYADRAIYNSIPENDRKQLQDYVSQNAEKYPQAVQAATQNFEKIYGKGSAKIVMGM